MGKWPRTLAGWRCALTIVLPAWTHAALIDNGDYVTDTASGLDWYKPVNTRDVTFADVSARLSTDLAGWHFASNEELQSLCADAGLPSVCS